MCFNSTGYERTSRTELAPALADISGLSDNTLPQNIYAELIPAKKKYSCITE